MTVSDVPQNQFPVFPVCAPYLIIYIYIKKKKSFVPLFPSFSDRCPLGPLKKKYLKAIVTLPRVSILTDKRNATTKKQKKKKTISSNYVEINQHKLLAVLCFEGISNFVQRYHQNQSELWRHADAKFEFEFPEDLDTFKDWMLIFSISLRYEWKNRRAHCIRKWTNIFEMVKHQLSILII